MDFHLFRLFSGSLFYGLKCTSLHTLCQIYYVIGWLFIDKISLCSPGWFEIHYVDKAGLEFTVILLPLLPGLC